jgi:hypothetical protein
MKDRFACVWRKCVDCEDPVFDTECGKVYHFEGSAFQKVGRSVDDINFCHYCGLPVVKIDQEAELTK